MSDNNKSKRTTIGTIGIIAAFVISYALHKSVLWAIFHLLLSWVYVLYAIVVYNTEIIPAIQKLFGIV
jgi:hypothetical protein